MNSEVSKPKNKFVFFSAPEYFLLVILFFAVLIRIIFFNGLIFSDDSYYNRLAFLGNWSSPLNYLGYPIFLLRSFSTLSTYLFSQLLGTNEIASVAFPFILSILSIILVYKISGILFNDKKISLTASFLAAFFPVDIIFASINFSDLQCVFFINLGILFFLKALHAGKTYHYILAGAFLAISILFKEYAYFYFILLLGFVIYQFIVKKEFDYKFALPLFVVVAFLLLEGLIYSVLKGDLLYRFHMFQSNYIYCYYDFFPYIQSNNGINSQQYYIELLKHIVNNIKYLFLRRYYLLLPIISSAQAIIFVKKREQIFLLIWFLGLIILLPLLSVSFSTYSPIELRRIWYIYPLIFPFCILSAKVIERFRSFSLYVILAVYLIASINMSIQFQTFFDIKNKNQFKQFIKTHPEKIIYTDHHTAYGLQLLKGFREPGKLSSITNSDSLFCRKGDYLVLSSIVLDELKKQGYHFPKLDSMNSDEYKLISSIGQFQTYEKTK